MTQVEEGYEQAIRDMVKVEKEQGLEKARQLSKYQGVTSLTRDQAMEIMSTIWPDAPQADKLAAAMLCATYGLNPLANHIFLIKFHNKRLNRDDWARVWGIRAKRLLASRKGGYSYLDMSPRLMTEAEQIKVWGEVDKLNLCFVTHLKDMKTGAEVYGYGKWSKAENAYGSDKGNSQANMASIRSESQAIDRLRPAEMPSGFTIADEDYINAEVREVAPEHSTTITFPKPEQVEPSRDAVTAEPQAQKEDAGKGDKVGRDLTTLKTITDMYKACHADFGLQPADVMKELNITKWADLTLTPAEAYNIIAAPRQ